MIIKQKPENHIAISGNMLSLKNMVIRIHTHEQHLVKSLTQDEEKAHSSSTEIQIIQPPLEIIKDCHIHEDKWYIVMLLGLWPETAASLCFLSESSFLGLGFTGPYVLF